MICAPAFKYKKGNATHSGVSEVFVRNKTSETPECAAFPFLYLNAGAQISRGGQVQIRENILETAFIGSRHGDRNNLIGGIQR